MDKDDPSRLARPDDEWTQRMVSALQTSPVLGDRYARALMVELVGEALGRPVSLREQATANLQLLELVRFCGREEGGLPALASAVSLIEGHSQTSDTVSALVLEHVKDVNHVNHGERIEDVEHADHAEAAPAPAPGKAEVAVEVAAEVPSDPQLPTQSLDFFISYTGADRQWAAWIAWQLEEAGYGVLVQEWDFVPGSSWPVGMERGVTECERTIAVLSPAYMKSVYGRQEWQAVQVKDALGLARRLLPVRVAPCEPDGMLASVVYVDLVGLPPQEASARLLAGVRAARTGRSKPALPPRFPG
ncbi:toll/interleukin-1 receptor domain-containing protein [Streptomyces cylindrosporus]|uniref:Toll/interleukin-1 receptor domain-containing protein n=1 Tax=Streptomyces cylindrosporus TaxID=2927583 RepID=A0ABS9Y5C9_9ACTN|nr:toll/interleukin-1 receptor domain-containing protein [Streptomyces cylindrosporus]MCI3272432.1 toll/interleukin-1 receptor domain-containing protein [Streptomyces cylindrosporus]